MSYFDTTEETILEDFDNLPAGTYRVIVMDAEERDTKSGNGKYVSTTLEVTEGKQTGRKIFVNHNIVNPNAQAQSIGRSNFAKFITACGKVSITDPSDLMGNSLSLTTRLKKNRQGEVEVAVSKYEKVGAATATTAPVGRVNTPSADVMDGIF